MAASGVRRGSKGSHLAIGSVDFTVCGEDDPADSSNRPGAAGAALRGRSGDSGREVSKYFIFSCSKEQCGANFDLYQHLRRISFRRFHRD